MNDDELGDLALATALLVVAGFVDAIGFLTLGHLFVSFASGNSTQFAIGIGGVHLGKAAAAGSLVGVFVVGVVGGRLIANAAKAWRRPAILLAETGLLVAAGLAPLPGAEAAYLMALAMGAQNAVVHKAGQTKTAVSYVTGTLVNLGERLADALSSTGPATAWLPYLLLWVGLICGGVFGAIVHGELGTRALLFPAAGVLSLAVVTALLAWRERQD